MKLIPNARRSWRFVSVWVNFGIATIVVAAGSAAPGMVVDALHAPLLDRIVIFGIVGAVFFLSHWAARVLKQGGDDAAAQ